MRGRVGRNTRVGPGPRQFHVSLFRRIELGGRGGLREVQLCAEVFNLIDTPQFNNPNANIGVLTAGMISSAGSPPPFQPTSRRIQIGAKFWF